MDTIELFRIFLRVSDHGSFIRAAETMNRPTSTISTAIRELESRLETRLFHRTTRRVSLTSDGIAFYTRCQVVVQDVEEAENLFRQASGQVTGKIKIDVPGRVGRCIVIPALPDFFSQYPAIQIEMGVTDRSINLVEEGTDCAVRVGLLDDSGMVARRAGYLKVINVASEAYISTYGLPESPQQLDKHFAVGYSSPTNGRRERWEWVQDGEVFTTQVNSLLTVNNAEAYITGCAVGMGMIQIPEYDVRHLLSAGTLRELMAEYRPRQLPVSILYPHRRHLSRPLQLFIAWLEPLLQSKMLLCQ